jgi:hypothetical protein
MYPRSIRKKTNMNKSDTWPGTYWATISHYGVRLDPARRRQGAAQRRGGSADADVAEGVGR